MPRPTKPQGQPTRGKTALNRLRQVDNFICLTWGHQLSVGAPLLVDVGYGEYAWTALEMHTRLQTINPNCRLLGIEIDPIRVKNALPHVNPPQIDFRLGGFNITDILGDKPATLIRAYNVLRQYDESAVTDALNTMADALCDGGLLIEGTSTPTGRIVAFDVYQKKRDALIHRQLVFGTNFRHADTPTEFQAILPKRLIHHAYDDDVATFFRTWERGFNLARGAGMFHHRRRWGYAGRYLHEQGGYAINTQRRIMGRGYLVLNSPLLP
ncbi:MAG: class I SAM-dependent methyltransferase [bacterium]|nr:class I SAM-dependent methyltransferase [bacterium]